MNQYSVRLRNEKKERLANRIGFSAEVEVFNLSNLKSALGNINDVLDALDTDPPKVASALSNARAVKTSVESALKDYPSSPDGGYRRGVVIVNPPPPSPLPAASLAAGTEEFNLRNVKRALRNIDDVIDALEADPPRVKSASSNAQDVKDAIEDAIDTYDNGSNSPRYRRIRVVAPPPSPPPPSPPAPPAPGMQAGSVKTGVVGEELATKAPCKKEGDKGCFPASDYAYTPNPQLVFTWKLRLTDTPGGDPDPGIVGAAVAALGPGFRGQKVQIPAKDLPGVKNRVLAAWKKAHPDYKDEDIPGVLK